MSKFFNTDHSKRNSISVGLSKYRDKFRAYASINSKLRLPYPLEIKLLKISSFKFPPRGQNYVQISHPVHFLKKENSAIVTFYSFTKLLNSRPCRPLLLSHSLAKMKSSTLHILKIKHVNSTGKTWHIRFKFTTPAEEGSNFPSHGHDDSKIPVGAWGRGMLKPRIGRCVIS